VVAAAIAVPPGLPEPELRCLLASVAVAQDAAPGDDSLAQSAGIASRPKRWRTMRSVSSGSMSPTTITAIRSGRYQSR